MAAATFLVDYEDTEPPSRNVLRVAVSGELVFLSVHKASQSSAGDTYERIEGTEIAVPLAELWRVLQAHQIGGLIAKQARSA